MELLGILYVIGLIVAVVFLVLLFWAPIKLYAIHRELVEIKEESRRQTRLLASIANVSLEEDSKKAPSVASKRNFLSDDSTT
jgi:hypothetical protein